jgi:hypothetical protein
MKLIILISILSVVSTIHGTNQVMPAAAQILHFLSQIPNEKDLSIEMRMQFALVVYAYMIKYNNLIKTIYLEALKKQEEEEKKRKNEEKLKEFLKKMIFQKTKPKAVLPFLRFLY